MILFKKYLPEFVYGSVDGVITTFAIIMASVGAGLSSGIVFVLGFASLLADGFSMGSSEYLSSTSENQMHDIQRKPAKPAINKGWATFLSFVGIGILPLLPFLITILVPGFYGYDVGASIILSLFSFVLIGFFSARLTKTSYVENILRTVFVGGLAAIISFGVGWLLRGLA